jgi:hypothetical protein
MTSPQFTQLPLLPPLARRADTWTLEEHCNFASQFYLQAYFGIAAAMLRDLGHERTYKIYAGMLHEHQKHFFMPGMKKLGLDKEKNQAAACAMYHCLSNGLGGLRTAYAIESDKKTWLMYFPYTADNAGSGLFALATYPELMLAEYRGWHGNNGRYLGNRGIRFVSTHYISEGDPFVGGYFEDTGRDLSDDELVIERRGEQPPPGMEIRGLEDELDAKEWPPERRARALRKYAVTWFADRVRSALHHGGAEGDGIARRGLQHGLHTWMARFRAAVGSDNLTPAAELAKFIEFFHTVAGIPAQLEPASNEWRVTTQKGLVDYVGEAQSDDERVRFARVIGDAWKSVAQPMDCSVSVDDVGTHWRISAAR